MSNSFLKNSIKNTIVAIALRLLHSLFPFVSRTIIINMLGFAYVGISSLFSSIFGLLSLAELGVGSAMLQALYKPIQLKQKEKINAILNFYKKAYMVIGLIILLLGIALSPFLKCIIKPDTYPKDLNIIYIYYTSLISTVSSYLIYAYKTLLLDAYQLSRVANKIRVITTLICYTSQILLLLGTHNYYIYVTIAVIANLISTLLVSRTCNKLLPDFKPKGNLNKEEKKSIIENIKSLFLYKIGSVIFNFADNIVISWWFGAITLGIYNNYYAIVRTISTFIMVGYISILPSIGNYTVNINKTQNYKNFMKASFLDSWVLGWCTICLLCLLNPFIELWIGEKGILNNLYPILFAIYFYTWRILDPVSIFKDALGLWQKDKWRPLIASFANLTLNILLIKQIGLYGILLSSIITVITISYPFSAKYLFNYFDTSIKDYVKQMIHVILVLIINGYITFYICNQIDSQNKLLSFFYKMLICIILPNIIYYIVYIRNNHFKSIKTAFINKFLHQKRSNNEA